MSTASTATATRAVEAPARASWLRRLATSRELGIFLALALVVIATTVRNPAFVFSPDGFRDLLLTPSILVVVAVGQAVVIISRNVDLSVGSILGLSAYLTGTLFTTTELPMVVVMLAGVALGALLGLVNGALVAFGRVPAMVITLGTLYAFRGINVAWTGSSRINASDLPPAFLGMGTHQLWGLPVLTLIALVVLGSVGWYLANTRPGREFYAIGSAPDAAGLYGLPARRRVFTAFVLSGALSGLGGVLYAARYGTVSSQAGFGFELQAIGAAVIGGVAIVGGVGTVLGAAIGAFLLLTISRALPVLGIPDLWQQALVGALIIGAIVLDRVLAQRQTRRLSEGRADA